MAHRLGAGVEIVPIRPHSDGDANHRPKPDWELVDPPTRWLEVLGGLWMATRGEAIPGRTYYLDRLPHGYRLYARSRPANAKIVDKHLYGHPTRKFFDSVNRFFPHFEHLMKTGSNAACQCTVCLAEGRAAPLSMGVKAAPRGPGRPPKSISGAASVGPLDEEGSPDPYRRLINKLRVQGKIDEDILENQSMDWICERDLLPSHLERLASQHSWMPRVGELVLFVRTFDNNAQSASHTDYPQWEAGVVTQVPDDTLGLQDLSLETNISRSVNYSGFRVEPLPDPNGKGKALSKQYKYVSLHHIRPFVFHSEYFHNLRQEDWHPTVRYALKVASSFSLLEKHRFTGSWPTAHIHCKAIFIGYELICIGDVVRLRPSNISDVVVEDVMRVTGIRLVLSNLDKASDDDADEGHPYNSTVFLTGKAFTLNRARAFPGSDLIRINHSPSSSLPLVLADYGNWYPLHKETHLYRIPFSRIIGRVFEPASLHAWFPHLKYSPRSSPPTPARLSQAQEELSLGLHGLLSGRKYSSTTDKRILPGQTWFWGDSRSETLDLETFNGVELSAHDPNRNPHRWRRLIKMMDSITHAKETTLLRQPVLTARPLRGPSVAKSLSIDPLQEGNSEPEGQHERGLSVEDDEDDPSGSTTSHTDRVQSGYDAGGASTHDAIMLEDSSSDASYGTAMDELGESHGSMLDSFRNYSGSFAGSSGAERGLTMTTTMTTTGEPPAKRARVVVMVPRP